MSQDIEFRVARDQRVRELEKVLAAARCIRHWHDRENGGMVVSGTHVRALWGAIADYDAIAAQPAGESLGVKK